MATDDAVSAFVASHPRLTGALLAAGLLLLQAGQVAANSPLIRGP